MTPRRGSALTAFGPITLAEITEVADLQTRVDRKYLVPSDVVWDALRDATSNARVLQIDGEREFSYCSTYFDTTDLVSFRGAAGRRRRRFKVRTRRYGGGECYLEVKTRDGRGRSVKHRLAHPADRARYLGDDDLDTIGRLLLADGIDAHAFGGLGTLLPMADTRYTRSTIFLPDSRARVTVDQGLTWRDPAGRELHVTDLAIVETKSSRAASDVDRALWRRGHRPRSLSKYGTGMTLLFPELGGNRWHRVRRELSGHLLVATPALAE